MRRRVNSTYTKMDKSTPMCYYGCTRCKGCCYNILKIVDGRYTLNCKKKKYDSSLTERIKYMFRRN